MMRLLLTLGIFLSADLLAAPSAAAQRPNIIFILADDLGYGDLGAYGQLRIKTPRLDLMAAEGVRFTRAYAGAPVCAPSRCTLMTGLHTGHARVRGNAGYDVRPASEAVALQLGDSTVASMLKSAGYATALVGKWGLGDADGFESGLPRQQGFDHFFGYLNQTHAHNSYPTFLWRNEERVTLPNIVPDETPQGAGVSSNRQVFAEDLIVDEALKFLRQSRTQPFFLYFAPTLPHANNESRPLGLEVPDVGDYSRRDWPQAEKQYAAMVTRLDADVGRILDLLKELKLDQSTLVLFASDNGPHREGGQDPTFFNSAGPLRGIKRALYEGGIRVPALARWPGHVPAGVTSDTPWYFPDMMPTLASLAGVPSPATDGVNVWPAFRGEPLPSLVQRTLYWEFYENGYVQAALRGQWKVVRPALNRPLELYDLDRDPGELQNVADTHPDAADGFEKFMREAHVNSVHWPISPGPGKNIRDTGRNR